jgi:FkbM family methyltransferase
VNARTKLTALADSLGARTALANGRDHLVDLLNGDHGGSIARRNQLDDEHLILLLSFGLRPTSNCLDVGAHRGLFLEHFPRLAPFGHHIAYEPLPELCAKLAQRFPEVDVRQRALSNYDGEAPFVHVLGQEALSGLRERKYRRPVTTETITVEVERLDDHLPEGWLPDFVKVDIEGAEPLAFEGAIRTLRQAKPVVAFEHGRGGSEDFGVSDDDLYKLLCNDVGLRLFDMDGHGPLDLAQFHDALAGGRWNWVAHE